MSQVLRSFVGLLAGAIVSALINLVTASIQNHPFVQQITNPPGIWISLALLLIGLIVGALFGGGTAQSSGGIRVSGSRFKRANTAIDDQGSGVTVKNSRFTGSTYIFRTKK